jgi:hypothetical protein
VFPVRYDLNLYISCTRNVQLQKRKSLVVILKGFDA